MKHRFRILLLLAALGSIARAAEPQIPWRAVNTGAPASVKSIGVLTPAANKLPYYTDATTAALADLSAFARTLLDDADATAARATLGVVIGTNVAPATSGTALLYGNGSGGFSNATVGGNLSFSGGTLNLSATPNIGAATGTSLNLSGNATVGGGGLVGAASTLALTGSGATTFRLDLAPTAANSSASSTIYNQPLASAGTASYARIGLLSGTNSRNFRIDTGGNGGATAGDIEIVPGSNVTSVTGNLSTSGSLNVAGTTASTSTTTGALTVAGGGGFGGAVYVGGLLNFASNLSQAAVGTFSLANGSVISGANGGSLSITVPSGTLNIGSANFNSGGFLVSNGNATLNSGSRLIVSDTTASTSTATGSATFAGGVGVAGAVNTGGIVTTGSSIQVAPSTANLSLIRGTFGGTNGWLIGTGAAIGDGSTNATLGIYAYSGPIKFYGSGTLAATISNTSTAIAGNLTVAGTQNTFGLPATASALSTNSTLTFELTSNTSLKILVRGSDGTTRSATLTLAP